MTTYIVFLRGINVGGHKKFPKASQLEILSELNLQNPKVYLHTGNWVFESSESKEILESKLLKAIREKQGWEVPILLKTASELEEIMNNSPFSEEVIQKSYFILLKNKPSFERIQLTTTLSHPNEKFHITENCVYVYYTYGAGNAKMGNTFFENKLKVAATARNYNTMMAILDINQQN
jgi:uncharacterized protein (DUF1697 family)